jgi:hypothetical protein
LAEPRERRRQGIDALSKINIPQILFEYLPNSLHAVKGYSPKHILSGFQFVGEIKVIRE